MCFRKVRIPPGAEFYVELAEWINFGVAALRLAPGKQDRRAECPPILMPTGSYPFTLIFSKESTTRPVVGTPNLVAGLNCVKIIRFFNSAVTC